jgi:catechol 2,3-dioxygenase-like lactoylglutathione lyase family enzyme
MSLSGVVVRRFAMEQRFDRAEEDLGNIVGLEHVNVLIPDQQLATLFYVAGLGLTRDPYLMTTVTNMWINVGRSQFHLPTGKPQVLRGVVGIVVPDRAALLQRLAAVKKPLAGTSFAFREDEDYVEAISPWGNRIRCHAPAARFGRINLGMPYVQLDVAPGTLDGIVKFYRRILDVPARIATDDEGRHALVGVGDRQDLIFRESEAKPAPYDGHHIAIYVADFSGPHRRLAEKGLISEESDQHQYRFQDIIDTESGKVLFTIEHEVHSMRHPLYARPLVNRNPAQTNSNYVPGADGWSWSVG